MAYESVFHVPGMSCDHCRAAVESEVARVPGVETVEVDLAAKTVVVRGEEFGDEAVRAAIDAAGYEVVGA